MLQSIFIICIGLLTVNLFVGRYVSKRLKKNENRNAVILMAVAFFSLALDYHITAGTFDNLKMPENISLGKILLERVDEKLSQM